MAHPKSDTAVDAGAHLDHGQKAVARRGSKVLEERGWGCDYASGDTSHTCPAEAGLRGWQDLHGTPSSITRTENGNRARRPSSAPVKRNMDKVLLCQGRPRLSHQQPMAIEVALRCGRAHHSTAHGSWGVAETEDLRKGLVRRV